MSFRNTISSYGSITKLFHWIIFLLVLCNITFGFFLDDIPKDYQPAAYNLHKLTGLTILALMLLRAIWALTNPKPLLPMNTRPWEKMAERTVHFLLYFSLIAMPLAGWVGSSAAGRPPHIGDINFLLPVEKSKELTDLAFNIHGIFALTIIILVSIHILAALFHHYIKKDNVLRRMLPGGAS